MNKRIALLSITILGTLTLLGGGCVKKNTLAPTTGLMPSISVSDQSLGVDNQIKVKNAIIGDDGWIVIHEKQNGQSGAVLGYTSLFKGEAKNIKVAVDKTKLTPSLIAMLYYDRGQKGVFEFPGTDGPVIRDQKVIMQEFNLSNHSEVTKTEPKPSTGTRKEFIITSKQWSFSPSEIKVKKGDTIVLKLKSTDVAHGVSIADFGINITVKPGEVNTVEFVADKAGTFEFICNIPCGVGHRGMTGKIIIE